MAEVRACGDETFERRRLADSFAKVDEVIGGGEDFLGLNKPEPPSERMLNFAHRLLRERMPFGLAKDAENTSGPEAAHEVVSGMSRKDMSAFIDRMRGRPMRPAQPHTQRIQVDEGMYRRDGVIYKVQRAIHGSGHLYAKRLDEGSFEFASGAVSMLRPEDKMTLEQAREYGVLYGTCCVCGRTLTNEESIEAGIGPVCAGKKGWFA